MAGSTTTSLKRVREGLPAEEKTSPIFHTDAPSSRKRARTESGEPMQKKGKLVHKAPDNTDDAKFDTPVPTNRRKIKNTKGKAAQSSPAVNITADQDMSDADTDDGEAPRQSAASAPTPKAPAKSKIFHPLPPVLANDLANNPYVPTDPAACAHYLAEVRSLQLHPTRTPLQTPNSKVSQQLRETMFERLFCDFTNDECIETYNKLGGNAKIGAAVSKTLLPSITVWFDEEGVVLPWNARTIKDKGRLKVLGLTIANFPIPHRTKVVVAGGAAIKWPRKATRALETNVQQKPSNDAARYEAFDHGISSPAEYSSYNNNQSQYISTRSELDEDENMSDYQEGRTSDEQSDDRKLDGAESSSEPEPEPVEPRKVVRPKRVRTQIEIEDEEVSLQYPMRDRLRAAMNVFGENSASIDIGGVTHTGKESAFLKYCRALREGIDVKADPNIPASIGKAFTIAISPFPRLGLPPLDFDFQETLIEQGMNSKDILGIMTNDKVDVKELVWDVEACVHMHKLCVAFDCAIVQDMVIDELHQIYQQYCVNNKRSEFILPVEYMNELDNEADEPLLRILIDIMLDQNEHGINFPKCIADDLVDMAGERSNEQAGLDAQLKPLHNNLRQESCKQYHLHAADEPCYHELAREPKTMDMMRRFYHEVGQKAFDEHLEVLSTMHASNLDHRDLRVYQLRLHPVVESSLATEEATAGSLYMLEFLRNYEARKKAAGERMARKYRHTRVQHRDQIVEMKEKHKKLWHDLDNPVPGSSMWRERWAGDMKGWYHSMYDPMTGWEEREYVD
jgi:hypothetical protein